MKNRDDEKQTTELEAIASSLKAIQMQVAALWPSSDGINLGQQTALEKAKLSYRSRRDRDKLFDNHNLFGEPAWDMLIDLFIAAEERKQISVSSLCIAAAVPSTTALRWISILEGDGLIIRSIDPVDARRSYLSLTAKAHATMTQYFENLQI